MPFILKNYQMETFIRPNEASLNVAKHIQMFQYLRDPAKIDDMLTRGYIVVGDAEFTYSESYSFKNFIIPPNYRKNNIGYSVYEETKFKNKSNFLKDFYKNERQIY